VSNARTQGHSKPEEVRVKWPGFQSIRLPHELWPCKKAHLLGTADASMEVASPPSVPTSVAAASAGTTPSRDINTAQLAAPARSAGGRRIQGPRRRGTHAGADEEVKAQGLTSGGGRAGGSAGEESSPAAGLTQGSVDQLRLQRRPNKHLRPHQPGARMQRRRLYSHGHFSNARLLSNVVASSYRWKYS
jgi:hypothetical protein